MATVTFKVQTMRLESATIEAKSFLAAFQQFQLIEPFKDWDDKRLKVFIKKLDKVSGKWKYALPNRKRYM